MKKFKDGLTWAFFVVLMLWCAYHLLGLNLL